MMIRIRIDGVVVHEMPARNSDKENERMAIDYIRSLNVSPVGMRWHYKPA